MQTSRQASRSALIAAVLITLLLAACGGGGEDTLTTVTPTWSPEVDTLDTFELRLERAAHAAPRPAVIDAAGFGGAQLDRICLVAHELGMVVINDGGACK